MNKNLNKETMKRPKLGNKFLEREMMRKGKDIQNIRVFAKTTRACNSINKETLAQVFFCEFGEISKNTFLHRPSLVTNFCLCVAKKKKKRLL